MKKMCNWVDILSALLTPMIAVFGSIIALQQWLTNKRRLKHELFDRRFKAYDTAKNFLGHIYASRFPTDEQVYYFRLNTIECRFLFNEVMEKYFATWSTKAYELKALHDELEPLPIGPARNENIRKQREILDWFEKQQEVLINMFTPYLKLKH